MQTFDVRKCFFHQLVQPFQALVARLSKNELVSENASDVSTAAASLAISATHFLEACNLPKVDGDEEKLRSQLRDVADTFKHGKLDKPERTIHLSVALAYEIDDENRSRFLKTEVIATNLTHGSFDLVQTIEDYLKLLNNRFGFGFYETAPTVVLEPFAAGAIAKISSNTFDVKSIQLRTYKRTASGTLVATDPEQFAFSVH